jgi:hypothetical protein
VRGKRATFNTKDQSEKKKNAARMANMISVEVPPEFGPGDVLDCKDSYGNLVQVHMPKQTDEQTNKQTNKQTNTNAYIHKYIHIHIHIYIHTQTCGDAIIRRCA